MRHGISGNKFGRNQTLRAATVRDLVRAILKSEAIHTTRAKAVEARKVVDRMITLGKDNTLAAKRRAYALLCDHALVSNLFNVIAPRFVDKFAGDLRGDLRIHRPHAIKMFVLHRHARRNKTLRKKWRELFVARGVPTQLGQRHKNWVNEMMRRQVLMTTVTMSATTTTAAATAASFFARVRIITRTGGSEGGKLFVEPRGTAVRTFRALPLGGANEDFRIAFALGTMKFVNRHGAKIIGRMTLFKRGAAKIVAVGKGWASARTYQGLAPLSCFLVRGVFSSAFPART